jgi:hypothetical protein
MMHHTKPFLLAGIAVLSLLGTGCQTSRFTFQFNDRTVEVEKFAQASLPRGLKVNYFDGKFMVVDGREAVTINGKDLSVDGSTIRFGDFTGTVGANQRIVITGENTLVIKDQKAIDASKSWWQFWR